MATKKNDEDQKRNIFYFKNKGKRIHLKKNHISEISPKF